MMHTPVMNLVCPVQNYDTYPSMPGALRAPVCPDPSVTMGIWAHTYARCHLRVLYYW